MLNVNHLTGFGVSEAAATGYRYLRLYITSQAVDNFPRTSEVYWLVGAVEHPTAAMTSNTAPSPLVASASSEYDGTKAAWKSFDHVTGGTNMWVAAVVSPGWLKIDLGSGNNIAATGVGIVPYLNYYPTAFVCEGSNTGDFAGEQATLYTYSGGTTGWSSGVRRNFTF